MGREGEPVREEEGQALASGWEAEAGAGSEAV